MKKQIILEKFGFNIRAPGNLHDLKDKKLIEQIKTVLSKKPLQFKVEQNAVCVLMSGADLVRIQIHINNKNNNELALQLAKQIKVTKDLKLIAGNVIVAELDVDYDIIQRRFVVTVE